MAQEVSIGRVIFYLFCLLWIPKSYRDKNQKIKQMKAEYGLDGDYSLEELERIRIEKDYQENFVRKLNLK